MSTSTISPERRFRSEPTRPLNLFKNWDEFEVTPLKSLDELAHQLGVEKLFVKNETGRMGLGSFKATGGMYAVSRIIANAAQTTHPFTAKGRDTARNMVFVTASAGNHGLAVAAGAKKFGARSVIVLPEGAPKSFARNITKQGGDLEYASSYEAAIAKAIALADRHGWIHLADGSWPGYVRPPAWIMEGYTILAHESRMQFESLNQFPTHIILQAGVGGLAAAFAANVRDHWPIEPKIIIVEPDAAPCIANSVARGKLTRVKGPQSVMGRLDCKDASLIAFESLRHDSDDFVTISDAQAITACRLLGEHGIGSTPSGSAGLAALSAVNLSPESKVLIVVSEGNA